MPIQGNDWWYVGGAAAGGAIVGALGYSLFSGGQEAGRFRTGLSRIYHSDEPVMDPFVEAFIVVDTELGGLDADVFFYNNEEDIKEGDWNGIIKVSDVTGEKYPDIDAAKKAVDGLLKKDGYEPFTDWGIGRADEALFEKPPQAQVSGRRKTRK